ncbi:MAG TPA: hypothetical protein VIV63_00620 [Steroidobacteraceae bacterium]
MTPGNLVVRAIYLATAVFGPTLALVVAAFMLSGLYGNPAKHWMTIASILLPALVFFVLPGARALRRLVASGTVLPPELVQERPVVAWVVSLVGAFGHFCFVISMSAAFEIALEPARGEDVGGPLAFAFMLALLAYLGALLCGELALVGDGESDAARARLDFS